MPVEIDGVCVLVKEEASDWSGSHKQRAADAIVAASLADGFARVVVGSCGNYGIAVAAAGRMQGAAVTVVLPADAGDAIDRVRALGVGGRLGTMWVPVGNGTTVLLAHSECGPPGTNVAVLTGR